MESPAFRVFEACTSECTSLFETTHLGILVNKYVPIESLVNRLGCKGREGRIPCNSYPNHCVIPTNLQFIKLPLKVKPELNVGQLPQLLDPIQLLHHPPLHAKAAWSPTAITGCIILGPFAWHVNAIGHQVTNKVFLKSEPQNACCVFAPYFSGQI